MGGKGEKGDGRRGKGKAGQRKGGEEERKGRRGRKGREGREGMCPHNVESQVRQWFKPVHTSTDSSSAMPNQHSLLALSIQKSVLNPCIQIIGPALRVSTKLANCLINSSAIRHFRRTPRTWNLFYFFVDRYGHIGDSFYLSKHPTNSVEALKENRVLMIMLQSPPDPPHRVTIT